MTQKQIIYRRVFSVILLLIAGMAVWGFTLGDTGIWVPALISIACGVFVMWTSRKGARR